MANPKSSFLDKVLGRLSRLDSHGLQTVVQRLANERNFLEMLFNAIEDGVLVLDETGRIIYFNHAVTHLIGLQPQTAEGQPLSQFLPEVNWEDLLGTFSQGSARTIRQEFEVFFPRPRYLRVYAAPMDGEKGKSAGLALILHDATEARQRTFEAIESERIQALTLLAASVAHEIGNPLNALHIHLQLMERELKKIRQSPSVRSERTLLRRMRSESSGSSLNSEEPLDRLDHFLAVAKGEISRLDYIVTQFLQAIRPSPPQLSLRSLNDVIRETMELLRPELENRGQTLKEKLAKQIPNVPLDAAQVKQALVNVIKNAMQSMSRGGQLTIRSGAGSEAVWVSVGDTGPGIPQEQLKRIFEPFFTTKKKGSGLGLMIVQRIVRDHGGRIDLESLVGQGTTFRIWFPLHERPPRLLGAAIEPLSGSGAAAG